MTRVQWLSNETPDRAGQGGQRRQFFQIRALVNSGHQVRVTTLDGPQDDTSVRTVATDVHRVGGLELRGRIPVPWRRRAVRRHLASWGDVVVVAHGESHERFEWALPPDVPTLVDLHNVYSRWPAEAVPGAHERWAELERCVRREADAVSVTSIREAGAMQDGRAPIIVVENGVDAEEWSVDPRPGPEPVLKLFGSWSWAPNAQGLDWLLENVWPAVHRTTGAKCSIAGVGVGPQVSQVAGVTVHGRVADLQHFLADAWAIAVPLPESVGSPVKYAEALAVGCPVISTSQGAPGHRDLPVISDDVDRWIETLTGWLGGKVPPETLGRSARSERLELLSWSRATEPLIRWVERTGRADE